MSTRDGLQDRIPDHGGSLEVALLHGTGRAREREAPGWVDPEQFLRDQRAQHAHLQVHQLGPAHSRCYVVIGYDECWDERERTHLTEDGRILDPSMASEDPPRGVL